MRKDTKTLGNDVSTEQIVLKQHFPRDIAPLILQFQIRA